MNNKLKINWKWNEEDSSYIRRKLVEYNSKQISEESKTDVENVGLTLKDEDGHILGGITGVIFWSCLHIDIFWIEDKLRGLGYGSEMLFEIEKLALQKECRLIKLDTFSFQAPDFYKKHGYEVFGTVKDFPKGHTQYYLMKRLKD